MTSVSIITPAYRAETFIARAVQSVLNQTHAEWEMIIVADDSQDYAGILEKQGIVDARLRFASTGRTAAGPAVARNIGLDTARFDIVANLDADDAYASNFLEHMLPAVAKHGAATSALRMISEGASKIMPLQNAPLTDTLFSLPETMSLQVTYADIMYDRGQSAAKWPEELSYGEDLLFWVQLFDDFSKIAYVASTSYDYCCRAASLSRPDEKDTLGLCERRNRMLDWLDARNPPIGNHENVAFLKRWLTMCNEIEEFFNYTLVEPQVYLAEMRRRLGTQ